MKSTKLLWTVIICLALGLYTSLLVNLGIINLPKSLEKAIPLNETQKVFHLTNMRMILNYDFSSNLPKDIAVVKLDFTIENVSKEPQTLYQNNISLFDYNNCRYDVSTTFNLKLNPLLFSETINPNTSKELSVIFEVPQNELYSVGYSDNIERIGKQTFVDKIRDIKCEYAIFKEMVEVRNHLSKQTPKKIKTPKTEEVAPKVLFDDEPVNSAYESLTKKGTNPANEIKVDLNDFLGAPDDGTDWTGLEPATPCVTGR